MLLINFPAPILFALLINEVRHTKYKKTVQTLTNFPHFISWVIFGGMIIAMTDMTTGIFNPILNFLGLSSNDNPVNLQGPDYAWATIIISSLIKGVGWGSIVYIAAIAGLDADMYEAADLEGANRFQKAIYITLPGIAPTITVFALLNIVGELHRPMAIPKNTAIPPITGTGLRCSFLASGLSTRFFSIAILRTFGCIHSVPKKASSIGSAIC
jgi:putative aldouronate transport system permease protein